MESGQGGEMIIYLAGGCFWGLEQLMRSLEGVMDAVSGYANGRVKDPTYEQVCTGKTGCREAVRVRYDPNRISLDKILFTFYSAIDPAAKERQGGDVGSQYQAGVYYADEESRRAVERVSAVVRRRVKGFCVEIGPLTSFYEAEAYHQRYLEKHPGGYCHIDPAAMAALSATDIDPGRYPRPDETRLRSQLSPLQYAVTQEDKTEPPFANAYWDHCRRGIYVDVATGEPLFSSRDKFVSDCGWPAFSAPIQPGVVACREDHSCGMRRIEVRSRAGDSHLGHVFYGESGAPAGVRYCINSAALRFVPYERMEQEGYGRLKKMLE